jgi:hypothetical protein
MNARRRAAALAAAGGIGRDGGAGARRRGRHAGGLMPNSIGAAVEFQNFATGECADVTGISIQHGAVRTAHATTPSGADVPQPDAVVALRKEILGAAARCRAVR